MSYAAQTRKAGDEYAGTGGDEWMPLPPLARLDTRRVAWEPALGGIYRDLHNRSLMVLSIHFDNILVEFADGHTQVLDIIEWRDLQPTSAPC